MKNGFFLSLGCTIAAVAIYIFTNQKMNGPPPDRLDFQPIPAIQKIKIPKSEIAKLQAFYLAFSDVLERDDGQKIATWNDFRELNIAAGKACFGDELRGGHRELGEAIDAAIVDIKNENNVDSKELSTRLREIAYSFGG